MAGNTSFSTLITTTLQNLPSDLFDSVIKNNALINLINKAGGLKTVVGGGRTFTEFIMHGENSTFAARGKTDVIPLTPQDPFTRAEYNVKILDGSVAIPTLELAMNAGNKEKLIDLAEALVKAADTSLQNLLGTQIWSTNVTANDLESIPRLISETPTADSDIGGIDSSATTQSFWRNYSYDTVVSAFGTAQAGLNAIGTSVKNSTFNTEGPTAHFTTIAIHELYELALTSNVRYTNLDMGDAAFRALVYGAGNPVLYDVNCVSGNWYGLDLKTGIRFKVLSEGNNKKTRFEMGRDTLVESMLWYIFCNLTMAQRRTSFVIDSITG